jgi:hypothetical protein
MFSTLTHSPKVAMNALASSSIHSSALLCDCVMCRDACLTEELSTVILNGAFHKQDAAKHIGFSLHVADVYMSELHRCCEQDGADRLPHVAMVALLKPFIVTLQRSRQGALVSRIKCVPIRKLVSCIEHSTDPYSVLQLAALMHSAAPANLR